MQSRKTSLEAFTISQYSARPWSIQFAAGYCCCPLNELFSPSYNQLSPTRRNLLAARLATGVGDATLPNVSQTNIFSLFVVFVILLISYFYTFVVFAINILTDGNIYFDVLPFFIRKVIVD